jgi:hypothetical protein
VEGSGAGCQAAAGPTYCDEKIKKVLKYKFLNIRKKQHFVKTLKK